MTDFEVRAPDYYAGDELVALLRTTPNRKLFPDGVFVQINDVHLSLDQFKKFSEDVLNKAETLKLPPHPTEAVFTDYEGDDVRASRDPSGLWVHTPKDEVVFRTVEQWDAFAAEVRELF